MADYSYTSLHDGRQEVEQYTGTAQTGFEAYRALTYRPNAVAGLYGQLLKQTLPQWQNAEFDVTGWGADLAPAFYFHGDYQNSTIKVTGLDTKAQYRYGYTPMGQAYGFKHRYSDEQMTRTFSSHSPNRNVVQNLYTGKYAEALTGLANMDARWYDAQKGRFIQGDQYNQANLMLPAGAQSELMRYIGRSQSDLLRDPAQQMRYGYVSGNALAWVDPLGLCETQFAHENDYVPTPVPNNRGPNGAPNAYNNGYSNSPLPVGNNPGLFGSPNIYESSYSNAWSNPIPGYTTLNIKDKPDEGDGAFGSNRSGNRQHNGIDVNAPLSTPVVAIKDGTVVDIKPNPSSSYGIQVVVDHGNDLYSVSAHLNSGDVQPGDLVFAGEQIGTVGRTGNTPDQGDTHLHLELREGSKWPVAANTGTIILDPSSFNVE